MKVLPYLTCALLVGASSGLAQSETRVLPTVFLSQGEWLGTRLSDSGRMLVDDAVQDASSGTRIQIDVNSWADMAATPEGQQRMSDRRIEATRMELLRLGVAETDIAVMKVETADGSTPPPEGETATKRFVIVAHY
ncbi:hypothetical protein [Bradyrhizobium iriomotense]|uniref:OmpA-like domain-containing protein n=1 Tax=Bradyrhizobium iriomotense TaxID=441950 RepID=A0ABQ6BCP8_9BRAD|nr:hypothetical protein [Bradyrhizobium iriomotense]GLR89948.1 hypothetical protein GCM10007857_66620 [Bradyrhizobium iriomotense]